METIAKAVSVECGKQVNESWEARKVWATFQQLQLWRIEARQGGSWKGTWRREEGLGLINADDTDLSRKGDTELRSDSVILGEKAGWGEGSESVILGVALQVWRWKVGKVSLFLKAGDSNILRMGVMKCAEWHCSWEWKFRSQ